MIPLVEPIKPYPGCPSLSWVFANRVCNTFEDQDAFIVFSGRKGSGKSTSGLSLAEDIAECISFIRHQNYIDSNGKTGDPVRKPPTEFFNIDHVVSVTKEGAIRLLTSGILQKENAVIILDDVSLQWNSRNFQTWINKALNDILTIARVFKCIIIANCVQTTHIDKIARELTDYRIVMMRKSTVTKQALFRCYYVEIGPDSQEYKHFITWKGKRIKTWVIGLPSRQIMKAYQTMRRENTVTHIDTTLDKVTEKLDGLKNKKDGRVKDENHPDIKNNIDYVVDARLNKHMSMNKIMEARGITKYIIGRCLAIHEERQKGESE